jgi:hypothetical protein
MIDNARLGGIAASEGLPGLRTGSVSGVRAGYARIPLTTFPWTFVRRRRMPPW